MRRPNNFPERKLIIAIDFDGTLVLNRYPFIENPNGELLDFIRNNREKYTFILYSCRTGRQLKYATDWLRDEQGIEFDYVNENAIEMIDQFGDSRKIYADIYIDDKAIPVEGYKTI